MPILDNTSSRAEQPTKIKTSLKPHQLALLHACDEFEQHNQNASLNNITYSMGLIADPVGAGKSLIALSIIANNKPIKKSENFNLRIVKNDFFTEIKHKEQYHVDTKIDLSVLIVPHPTMSQWKQYIKNEPNIKCIFIDEKKNMKKIDEDITKAQEENSNLTVTQYFETFDMVCISSIRTADIAKGNYKLGDVFTDYSFTKYKRIFIDEVDSIQIHNSFPLHAEFTWFISSSKNNLKQFTPKSYFINPETGETSHIYNYQTGITSRKEAGGVTTNNRDIKRCFQHFYYNTKYFDDMCFENTKEFIAESFMLNNPKFNTILCKNPAILKIIGEVLNKNIINMINGGDIQGAINSFKCEKTTSDNLISVVTKSIKEKMSKIEIKIINIQHDNELNTYGKTIAIAKENKKKDDLNSKIKGIEEKVKENQQCVICYDEPENPCYTKCCNTKYCLECLTEVMKANNSNDKAKCPYCRADITNDTMLILNDTGSTEHIEPPKINDKKEKYEAFTILLEKLAGDTTTKHKILIFSDYGGSFINMKCFMDDKNYKYCMLNGPSKVIGNKVAKYKTEDKIDIMLLNSKFCGSGLNLENTTDIIMYHSVSKDLEMQIIGRAHRPGHIGDLNVWKMLNENEA
jgi:SNF2 family DNA or RNA helicase